MAVPRQLIELDPTLLARVKSDAKAIAQTSWQTSAGSLIRGADESMWMSPLEPIMPFAPQNVGVRSWDYPVGINIRYTPRKDVVGYGEQPAATFEQLRFFAYNVDVMRILIETRKDQVSTFPWGFRFRDEKKHNAKDPRLEQLTQFFRFPDPVNKLNFRLWARKIVEDLLVIDAPALYVHRNKGGQPIGLIPIDGASIKPLITATGSRPLAPDPAYQQIIHGVPTCNLSTNDLIYYPRNQRTHTLYGYPPVEQILNTLNLFLRRQIFQIQFFTEANEPRGFLAMPTGSGTPEINKMQEWLDSKLAGNTAERRRVIVTPNGVVYTDIKPELLTDKFDQWLAQLCCGVMSISPQVFMFGQMNRASANTAREEMKQEGLQPLLVWFKDLIDLVIEQYFGIDEIEFMWAPEEQTDQAVQSVVDDRAVRNGTRTINAVRADRGEDPVDGGDTAFVVVGAQLVPVAELPKMSALAPPPAPGQGPGPSGAPGQAPGGKPRKPAAGKPAKPDDEGEGAESPEEKVLRFLQSKLRKGAERRRFRRAA